MKALKTERLIPRVCLGHIREDGKHVKCSKVLANKHRACKRCDECKETHDQVSRRKYQQDYYNAHRKPQNAPANRPVAATEGRTPVRVCNLCGNLPERRPQDGCPRCGMAPGPAAPLQRCDTLRSSAGMAVGA
jgi:hypothetical protein